MSNRARIILEFEKLKNQYSGLGQFCLHLGHALVQEGVPDLQLYLPKNKFGLFGPDVAYLKQQNIHKLTGVRTYKSDVFHCTHQTGKYFPSNKNTAVVLTVHDLNFLYQYQLVKRNQKLKELQKKVDRASAITVISNFVAHELEQHIDLKGKKPKVVYNGPTLNLSLQDQKPDIDVQAPFIFTIGIIAPRKNFHVLLPFLQKLPDVNLVIAGNAESRYAQEIREEAKKAGLLNRVIICGNVTEAEKIWLYKNCLAFVFPSLAEGFGLPVLEAMSVGKPVFLNKATSLPEIGGELAFYWHNFDPNEMKKVFENGIQTFQENHLADQYKARALEFNWQKSAQAYIQVYNGLLE